jgi:tetratricopeptide (TPR) repeat protein
MRIAGISENQIRYWDKIGLVPAVKKDKGRLLYDFKALIALRTIRRLLDGGMSTRKIRQDLAKLKQLLPEIENPLAELRITLQGKRVLVRRNETQFTPEGQMQIRFEETRPPEAALRMRSVEDSFFGALSLEEEGNLSKALAQYTALLKVQPDHPDALVNMGNIRHRQGLTAAAEQCYRKALQANPDHTEANYNLANIFEFRGELENAVLFYIKSIHADPEFADAHFNLARTLERIGQRARARKHWRIYLKLDPSKVWADFIRDRLKDKDENEGH